MLEYLPPFFPRVLRVFSLPPALCNLWEGQSLPTEGKQLPVTHICLVDLSILINWTNPFPILWVVGVLFIFSLFQIDIPVSKQ